ncbi:MAG: hypothetical protein F6K30_10290 [Cyanothece sp. SIO2G6]|nr:hypothetical protein [Cyanothece sp. SIO2G6]
MGEDAQAYDTERPNQCDCRYKLKVIQVLIPELANEEETFVSQREAIAQAGGYTLSPRVGRGLRRLSGQWFR